MRRLLRAAAGLLLLVLLVPAAFLTRAHLQVRGVAPPLPGRAQLTAALAAGPGPVRLR